MCLASLNEEIMCIIIVNILNILMCDEQTVVQDSQGHMAKTAAPRLKEEIQWKGDPEASTQLRSDLN